LIIIAAFEAPRVVAGLDDVAVVCEAVEQGCRHFGVAEHAFEPVVVRNYLKLSDCLAGDAVLIAPVSRQIPCYQGI
jgi:hypothetical protein